MKYKIVKNTLMAMVWVSFFVLALNAPYIPMKTPIPETIGYLACFGFFGFAIVHFILIKRG